MIKTRAVGLTVSLILHAALLAAAGSAWVQPVEYGVETGLNSIEVNLVAALPASAQTENDPAPTAEAAEAVDATQTPPIDPILTPETVPEENLPVKTNSAEQSLVPLPPAQPAIRTTARPVVRPVIRDAAEGDGSAKLPGKDSATLRSGRSAVSVSEAGYLKNPAPPYPETARLNRMEGTVLLEAEVDRFGAVNAVRIEKSSGHALLDEAALRTVQRWRFKPAAALGVAVESTVRIPIRFSLSTTGRESASGESRRAPGRRPRS